MQYNQNFAFYVLFHYCYVISEALFQELTEKEVLQESWTVLSFPIQL